MKGTVVGFILLFSIYCYVFTRASSKMFLTMKKDIETRFIMILSFWEGHRASM